MNLRLDATSTAWKRPVPFLNSNRDKWLFIWMVNLFCAFFLLFFQPFGVNNYDPSQALQLELLIGVGAFMIVNIIAMIAFEFILHPLFLKANTRYHFALRLLILLIFLSTTTYLTYNFLGDFHDWSWKSYFGFIRDIGSMTSIPVTGIVLYLNQRHVRQEVDFLKKQPQSSSGDSQLICLTAENEKDKLYVQQEQLLLLEAQDNYVGIYYWEQDQLKRTLFRTSLKRMEMQLEGSPLLRCHRSYIIHPKHLQKAKGNAHQLQLTLAGVDRKVPVSRSYIPRILSLLDTHPE